MATTIRHTIGSNVPADASFNDTNIRLIQNIGQVEVRWGIAPNSTGATAIRNGGFAHKLAPGDSIIYKRQAGTDRFYWWIDSGTPGIGGASGQAGILTITGIDAATRI